MTLTNCDVYDYVLTNCGNYFNHGQVQKWIDKYKDHTNNIAHDEPWLTLMALYSMFGDQNSIDNLQIALTFQKAISNIGLQRDPKVKEVEQASLELVLPEIQKYKDFVYKQIDNRRFHLYPDREAVLKERNITKKQSIEGNTNLDAQIKFIDDDGKENVAFIEAKYLSDIATMTRYNPVRNQIIRNIDVMIDQIKRSDGDMKFDTTYFWLLTPQIFRTDKFGGGKPSSLSLFNPQHSRYYSYMMNYYKNPGNLEKDLPHRKLEKSVWETISNNIGWLTFEDIVHAADVSLVVDQQYIKDFNEFFEERNLV